MNYTLITKEDGTKTWAQLVYNKEKDTVEHKEIDGPIILDPKDFYKHDEVAINSSPPPDMSNAMPLEDLLKELEKELGNTPRKEFKPYVYYCNESPGQAIEVVLSSEGHIAKWINPWLSVYYDPEDETRVMGLRVDGLIYLKTRREAGNFNY